MLSFFTTLIIYIYTMFSSVAPYRDTGEMVSVAHTLGIAHPPGYPLYTLLSKIILILIPLGNAAYRLNILSALGSAFTVLFLYKFICLRSKNKIIAYFLSIAFGVSYLQWYLSLVSEMYTLNTVFAAIIIYLLYIFHKEVEENKTFNLKIIFACVFIFAFGLGVRMDLLFMGAAIAWLVYKNRKYLTVKLLITMSVYFILGYSVYYYLLVRSSSGAWLDWNHPATFERLWASIARKTHGGTLDLISTGYKKGENFVPTIVFYIKHLTEGFFFVGPLLGLIGAYRMLERDIKYFRALFFSWLLSGPIFIFLANMPPNTHALVILEAHFLLPNLIFFIFIVEGIILIKENFKTYIAIILCIIFFGFNIYYHQKDLYKRNNFIAYDYTNNVLRSLPYSSAVVVKEDVQIFSFWNKHLLEGKRKDIAIVAQGLSNSFWYKYFWDGYYENIVLGPLRSSEDWEYFVKNNVKRDVYFTNDTDYFIPNGYKTTPQGLVNLLNTREYKNKSDILLNHIYPYRGKFMYSAYKEFFTPDLIEDYAKSFMQSGIYYFKKKDYTKAREQFKKAIYKKDLMPIVYSYIAYSYLDENKLELSKEYYEKTINQFEKYLIKAKNFNSMPNIIEGINKDYSAAMVSLGVVHEKLNLRNKAIEIYKKAIDINPANAQAYYNCGVMYWHKKDWGNVKYYFEKALRYNPNLNEARYFLNKLKS